MSADTEAVAADPHEWTRRPVLRQRWTELAYFHWRYEPDAVQRLLPGGVRVDTFDGSAWFGLIPFEMRDVQVGPTPPFPWLGSFIEINVGIYVVDVHGRRAVWFFSLDVLRSAIVAVAVARTAFSPPYCWAIAEHKVAADQHRYQMTRRWLRAGAPHADIGFRVGDSIDDDDVTDLDHFLSARWGLVTSRWNRSLPTTPRQGPAAPEPEPVSRIDLLRRLHEKRRTIEQLARNSPPAVGDLDQRGPTRPRLIDRPEHRDVTVKADQTIVPTLDQRQIDDGGVRHVRGINRVPGHGVDAFVGTDLTEALTVQVSGSFDDLQAFDAHE